MARLGIMDTISTTMTTDEDDIEAELFASTREMGVACFAMSDFDLDEGAADS